MDPVTAFAMVQGAVTGVRKLCALVKEAQQAGKEVADLTSQVTSHVGKVLEHTQELKKAELEVKKNPPKGKSLQVLAFEEVARKLELKRQYEELRNMVIYELGLPGGFWADFEQTLHRLEQEHEREMELAEQMQRELEWQRRVKIDQMQEVVLEVVVILVMLAYLVALIWSVMLHHRSRLDVWLAFYAPSRSLPYCSQQSCSCTLT
jgi:uncharacterized tellurite resistance protein B-like protein